MDIKSCTFNLEGRPENEDSISYYIYFLFKHSHQILVLAVALLYLNAAALNCTENSAVLLL